MSYTRKIVGLFLIAAAVVSLRSASVAAAATISVNFEGAQLQSNYSDLSQHGPLVTTAAGAAQASNWNNAQGPAGTLNSLLDGSGAATAASVTYTSPNVYNAYTSPPSGTGDSALMQGYLDNFSNAGYSITVSGLGAAFTSKSYDVLVYQNTDSIGAFGYKVTDSNGHTSTAYGQQTIGNGGNYPLSSPGNVNGYVGSTSTNPAGPGVAANYVVLTGFSGSDFTLVGLVGLVGTNADGRARIEGFQIVGVPEPSSLVLCSLSAIGLLVAFRRRKA
jgi:hypothetical protein